MHPDPRVNLFIVGAPKCGTTAWWSYLSQHPQVFMTARKEPHFFSKDFPGFRWVKQLNEYEALFETGSNSYAIRGEASVMYLYSRVAAQEIYEYNPSARILVFLRDHEPFIRSYHRQLCLNLDENEEDLLRAINLEKSRQKGRSIPGRCREPKFLQYRQVACFAPQVERYLRVFPRDQVMVLRLEQWSRNPVGVWNEVQDFLNLDRVETVSFEPVNEARAARSRSVASLYRSPPSSLLVMSRALKSMGVDTRSVARRLRSWNERRSIEQISTPLPKDLIEEFQTDREKLRKLLPSFPGAVEQ